MTTARGSSVRDYRIYISVGCLAILAVFLMARMGVDEQGFIKWFGLAFFSSFLYGAFISDNRDRWKTRRFWVAIISTLGVHFGGFIFLLIHVQYWRLIWFAPMFLELPILMRITAYIHHWQE